MKFTYLFSNKQAKLFSICLEQLACDFLWQQLIEFTSIILLIPNSLIQAIMTLTISVFFPDATWPLSTRISHRPVLSSIMTSKTSPQWCRPTTLLHLLKIWLQPLDLCPTQYELPLYPKCLSMSSVNSSISQILFYKNSMLWKLLDLMDCDLSQTSSLLYMVSWRLGS